MTTTNTVDAARVELLLSELRLPGIKLRWATLAAQSDKEGWPAARFLAALAEHEVADRSCRRMERHLAEARLPAVTSGVNFTQNHRFEIPDDVVSASGPDPIKGAAVLGPIKAKPCGWPRRRGQP